MKQFLSSLGLTAVLFVSHLPTAGAQALPRLGEDGLMPLAEELRLGLTIAGALYQDHDYIDDPLLTEYVDGLFGRLVQTAKQQGAIDAGMGRFPWLMIQGADTSVNAFAVPGGVFGLHLATIGVTEQPDELASVLAHELSHVTQRHIARMQVQQKRLQPLLIGSVLLGAIAAGKNSDAGTAVLMGGQGLAAQSQLAFSRDMEREADRLGLALLEQAGFRASGFVSMFEKLQHANRINDSGNYPYLRSHPLTTERIAAMRLRSGFLDSDSQLEPLSPDVPHRLMAARARVLATGRVDSWRTMQEQAEASLRSPSASPSVTDAAAALALLYQGSVAALQLKNTAAAKALSAALTERSVRLGAAAGQSPEQMAQLQRLGHLLGLEVAKQQGQWAALLQPAVANSARRPEFLLHMQAQLASGAAARAKTALQQWLAQAPRDAAAWLLLAQAYGRLQENGEMARAQGEAAIAQFDYPKGLTYLESARRLSSGNHYALSMLDARIRQVQGLQADLMAGHKP